MRIAALWIALVWLTLLPGETAFAASEPTAASDKSHTPEDVFRAMNGVFQADKAKGLHIRYQFAFTEPMAGNFWVHVNDGKVSMGKGTIENPHCTIRCTGEDWVRLDNDTLSGIRAYLTGRLKIDGDRGMAKKLNDLFP